MPMSHDDDPLLLADEEYHRDLLYTQHSVISIPNNHSSWHGTDGAITIRRHYEYLETEDSLKGLLGTLLFVFIIVIMVVVALVINPRM